MLEKKNPELMLATEQVEVLEKQLECLTEKPEKSRKQLERKSVELKTVTNDMEAMREATANLVRNIGRTGRRGIQ